MNKKNWEDFDYDNTMAVKLIDINRMNMVFMRLNTILKLAYIYRCVI